MFHSKKLLILLAAIPLLAGVTVWITYRDPLSPKESQLLGTWRSIPTGDAVPGSGIVQEYRWSRKVIQTEFTTGTLPGVWRWRIEGDDLVVEQEHSMLQRILYNPPPDIGRFEVISLSEKELILGPKDNPSTFVRIGD